MKVALYARVSSERQEQDATIDSQIASLKDLAAKQGDTIIEVYQDDGYSGELLARPALDRLRDDAAKKQFERVLVLAPDRLARKLTYAEVIAEELKRHNVTIQYVNYKNDGTAEGDLLLGVLGKFAEYEKVKILERSRRGKLHKARMGFIVTGHAPYGYRYIPKSAGKPGHLVVDLEKAGIVRLIFGLYSQGLTVSRLILELARKMIAPPCRDGVRRYWSKSTIKKILKNETYAGVWHYQKHYATVSSVKSHGYARKLRTSNRLRDRAEWIPVDAPAIIDRELYDRAQTQMQKNTVFSSRNSRHEYLLRGLLRCGECGRAWQGTPCHGKTYYRCTNRQLSFPLPRTCRMGMRQSAQMDGQVWTALKTAFQDPALLLAQIPKVQAKQVADFQALPGQLDQVSRQWEVLKASEGRLLEALTAGAINVAQLKTQMDLIRAKEAVLVARELELQAVQPSEADITPSVHAFCQKIARGLAVIERDFSQKQALIREVVTKAVVYPSQVRILGAIPCISAGLIAAPLIRANGHKYTPKIEFVVVAA